MLALENVTLQIDPKKPDYLLRDISLNLRGPSMIAIVGPSGSGKSTLLKVITGLLTHTSGNIYLNGRNLLHQDFSYSEIGYVPQFNCSYEYLTVRENIETALRLHVVTSSGNTQKERVELLMQQTGLSQIANLQARFLSGGQKRKLSLALEIVGSPQWLLCDEVTSGLDPESELEVTQLMRDLVTIHGRTVVSITHSMQQLSFYDSIVVLYGGHLAYEGDIQKSTLYFDVNSHEQIFRRLSEKSAREWHFLWQEFQLSKLNEAESKTPQTPVIELQSETSNCDQAPPGQPSSSKESKNILPGMITQSWVLLKCRFQTFRRDKSQTMLQALLIVIFPVLVVIFALDGLPQIQNLNMSNNASVLQQLKETNDFILQSTRVGGLVSGLLMFQVILLTLMGSNNSAREIAAERSLFEKRKLSGLRPISYLISKYGYLSLLTLAQSLWMAVFVNWICRFPGNLIHQILLLWLVNLAMSAVCLGISSLCRTAEQASLISIYIIGFQLPLSGAILCLPSALEVFTRPFVAAYWSWSGLIQTMKETRFYDVATLTTKTHFSATPICIWVLGMHFVLGVFMTYVGCKNNRWE